ncbi:MAG: hypothetical protein HQL96_01015 [Magnetococcales bacterium]|nr:hypothetical protein [Magnetococcales bacterium]
MSSTATVDDVLVMIRETGRMFQEMVREDRERRADLDRKFRTMREETNRQIQEISEQLKETARQMRETDRKMQETARQMRETDRKMQETDRQMQETDRKMQETDRQMRETDRKMQETDRRLDRLGGRLGEFVEGLVAPACKTLFIQWGIPVHQVSRRVEADLPGGRHIEIDLFVVNTDAVALVEVKSKLTVDDVREHLERLSVCKEFFPRYADCRVYGAVAAMVIEENVSRFAIGQGLFVIEQTGDTLRMANAVDFKPRAW